jgi:hypothetical protein
MQLSPQALPVEQTLQQDEPGPERSEPEPPQAGTDAVIKRGTTIASETQTRRLTVAPTLRASDRSSAD